MVIIQKKPKNRWAFFVTPTGRKVVGILAGATTLGLCVGNWVPHTLALKKYMDFVQCYESGVPRPVPAKVLQRLDMAMDMLELSPYERKIVKPFTVVGFDLFQAGSLKYRSGAAIGIPVNFSYESTNDIKRNKVRFRGDQPINWQTEYGKNLEESLVLTEAEQIFGFCKSLLQLQTHRVLLNSLFPAVTFLGVYSVGSYLNLRMGLLNGPFSLRLVMYTLLAAFGAGSWSFMKDFTQVSYDADIDKKLSSMGPKFVEAGIGYYDKILKKNMALRALIGDDTYTAKGNENYFLRQKAMPITLRKSFFEQKLKELDGSAEKEELA